MTLFSTIFVLFVATLVPTFVLAQNTPGQADDSVDINYVLNVSFEGIFKNICDEDVVAEINEQAVNVLNFLMKQNEDAIGGQVIFDETDEVSESFTVIPTHRSERHLAVVRRTFILRFHVNGRCRMCSAGRDYFDDTMGSRRSLRGGSSISLSDAIELELNGLFGLTLSNEFLKYQCLAGATGVKIDFAPANEEEE